jgi:hypothetical protein
MDARFDDREADVFGEYQVDLTGYAVDRFGNAAHAQMIQLLVRDVDHDSLVQAIAEFGLQDVAEQYLRTLINEGTLHGDEVEAYAEESRILDSDPHASPEVHAVTVADLADEFTRLGLTDAAASCGI